MEVNIIILSEISQIQKDKYHILFPYAASRFFFKIVQGGLFVKGKGISRQGRKTRQAYGGEYDPSH
jgi:hypothetical protein